MEFLHVLHLEGAVRMYFIWRIADGLLSLTGKFGKFVRGDESS